MAYNLKWQIPFVNDKGESRTINIYVEGYEGEVMRLEGGESPITTQESTDEDMLCPLRSQTGYIRVIDNGDLEGLTPTTDTQHKVELKDANDSTLWIGYMKAAEYSASWSVRPNEVQLPIISRLEALGSIDMDSSLPMGMITFGELIAEAARAVGEVEDVWIPAELYRNGGYWWPMKLTVSRALFFERNNGANFDDPDYREYKCNTYKEMMQKIMSLFGWCMRERGKDWVISSPTTKRYIKLTVAQLAIMAATTTLSCTEVEADDVMFESLAAASTDHKRDVIMGSRTFEVEAKTNGGNDFLPTFEIKDFSKSVVNEEYNCYDRYGNWDVMFRHGWIGNNTRNKYNFHAWSLSGGVANETNWIPQLALGYNGLDLFPTAAAAYGQLDICTKEEVTDGTKKYWQYNEGLVVRTRPSSATISLLTRMPLVEVVGKNICNIYGGALCWNPSIVYDYEGDRPGYSKVTELLISVRVGDKWWNGSTWTNTERVVQVQMQDDGKNVVNQKNLTMPYNDAEGYIMPVFGVMSGEVRLTIYAIRCDYSATVLLQNVSLKYEPIDEEIKEDNETSNHYYSVADEEVMAGRKKVTLEMATDNNNAPGYGILFIDGDKVSGQTFEQGRLEEVLLGKLKRLFGRKVEKLTLHIDADEAVQPMARIDKAGVKYQLLSEARDWMTDESTIICESLPGQI